MSAWEGDLLGRAEVAEFLQNLLENDNDDIKVVNIDSPWGTGKTFFLERWCKHLSDERGVVYFNAWEKDYTGDPFISLVSAIRDQLKVQRSMSGDIEDTIKDFTTKAKNIFLSTAPGLTKLVSKGLLKKLIAVEGEELAATLEAVTDEVADKAVEALIVNSEKDHEAVKQFREVFEKLVTEVSAEKSTENGSFPVYVFIDELDRCRPTYAIELLERIKHFFDVPGCIFIIATDTKQLGHSIKAVYGGGFDSFEYLKRFFDITYSLDNSDVELWVSANFDIPKNKGYNCLELTRNYNTNRQDMAWASNKKQVPPDENAVVCENADLNEMQIIFVSLFKTFRVSLRDLMKIRSHIKASISSLTRSEIHFFLLCYLVFLKNSDVDLYKNFIKGDEKIFIESANKKYPPWSLYFITKSVSVHDIALCYLNASKSNPNDLRERLNKNLDRLNYQVKILLDACNGEDYSKYFKLVDLAIQIK
ncbi:P-loop NTPase fold protein [Halomonas sp. SpR1]|uniref:KAP family P-loop NTPase fold protein n=1 Tax=Halomonas sp. SpR1 TaxID=3050462 RepID=UPI0027E5905F|nr:P-loop NTPase fold protein [Halomonas sp. SpR1]MDQ7735797.1 P-loop NTPase fold protein [Halomonas sp. SpR1]